MPAAGTGVSVRAIGNKTTVVDIPRRLTAATESDMLAAMRQVEASPGHALILNMSALALMDSAGLALLMSLLAPARRRKQLLLAYGLNAEYRQVFALVRLGEAVRLCANEREALAAAGVASPGSENSAGVTAPALNGGNWAQPVARLKAPALPRQAVNLNVDGRRPLSPLDGFGRMVRKTYSIRLAGSSATPFEVIAAWKERFASFWPAGNNIYGPHPEITVGDTAVLNLTLMGPLKLYTGVLVIYGDESSFCFMTPEGHMFGGLIVFSAHTDNGVTVAQVQPTIRASDPMYEATLRIGLGSSMEDLFWRRSLNNLAAFFGAQGTPQQTSVNVDGGVQWSRLGNIWHNAAIRTTLYMPVTLLRRLRR